jgi:hypothetical protein
MRTSHAHYEFLRKLCHTGEFKVLPDLNRRVLGELGPLRSQQGPPNMTVRYKENV